MRPWLGDSIGRWEGDTLVVETTNIHPAQLRQTSILWAYRGASHDLKVTERFTRTGPDTMLYKFTMEDPATFTAPFSGELPFTRIDEMIYEYALPRGQLRDGGHPVGRTRARTGSRENQAAVMLLGLTFLSPEDVGRVALALAKAVVEDARARGQTAIS